MTEPALKYPRPNPEQGSLELTEDYIRVRAYQLFEQRGCEHGHDMEDWLIAEAEILGKKPATLAREESNRLEITVVGVAA